jgi:hypothetical protein
MAAGIIDPTKVCLSRSNFVLVISFILLLKYIAQLRGKGLEFSVPFVLLLQHIFFLTLLLCKH